MCFIVIIELGWRLECSCPFHLHTLQLHSVHLCVCVFFLSHIYVLVPVGNSPVQEASAGVGAFYCVCHEQENQTHRNGKDLSMCINNLSLSFAAAAVNIIHYGWLVRVVVFCLQTDRVGDGGFDCDKLSLFLCGTVHWSPASIVERRLGGRGPTHDGKHKCPTTVQLFSISRSPPRWGRQNFHAGL